MDRHRAIVTASERLARAGREAARGGNHARAALFYGAAVFLLEGHSTDEVSVVLAEYPHLASLLERGTTPPIDKSPREPVVAPPLPDDSGVFGE